MGCLSSLVILFLVGFFRRESTAVHTTTYNGRPVTGIAEKNIIDMTKHMFASFKLPFLHLRSSDSRQLSPLDFDVKFVSDSISDEARKFLHSLGLIDSDKIDVERTSRARIGQFDKSTPNTLPESINHEVFAFIQKFVPISGEIKSSIQKHLHEAGYHEKGYSKTQFTLGNNITQNPPYIIGLQSYVDGTEFIVQAYLDCLNASVTPFNVILALAKLVKYPPEVTKKIVTLRLSKPIPNNPNTREIRVSDAIAMSCRMIVENPTRDDFENCLKQIVTMNQCVQNRSDKNTAAVTRSILRSNRQLTRDIKMLNTTCDTIQNGTSTDINCGNHHYRNLNVPLLSLIERIFGGSFIPSAASRNVVRNLGNLMMKNEWSSNMMREAHNLVDIYQEASKKEKYLLRRSKSDPRAFRQYNKHSRQLTRYTKNLSDIAMNVVGRLRGITSSITEALVQTVSNALGLDMSDNLRALKRCGTFWNNLRYWLDNKFNQALKPKPETWQEFWGMNRSIARNNDKNLTNNDLLRVLNISNVFNEDWITSIGNIERSITHRKSSTIMTLANTFLLAIMFYEFIVILAGAIYQTGSVEDTTMRPIHTTTDGLINIIPSSDSDYFDFGVQEPMYRRRRAQEFLYRGR